MESWCRNEEEEAVPVVDLDLGVRPMMVCLMKMSLYCLSREEVRAITLHCGRHHLLQ